MEEKGREMGKVKIIIKKINERKQKKKKGIRKHNGKINKRKKDSEGV